MLVLVVSALVGLLGVIFYLKNRKKPLYSYQYNASPTYKEEWAQYYTLLEEEHPKDLYKDEMYPPTLKKLLDADDDMGDFDPVNNETLNRFNVIKQKTACIYAKRAKVWGTPWDDSKSAKENFKSALPVFARYVKTLKLKKFVDAIIVEARGDQYCDSVASICNTFRDLSEVLSENDPCQSRFLDNPPDDTPIWSYTFGDEAFFITTFAKCYPPNHPRHSYGLNSLFILMQPEISFRVHEIPVKGTPGTPRYKIREAFKAIGQPYEHNEPRNMPVAWWFVRPVEINTEKLLQGHVTEDDEHGDPVERGYEVIDWWSKK